MSKRFRMLCLVCFMVFLPLLLAGCSSKTLKKDQYQIYHQNNTFTVKVTDNGINAENIETVKVKIKYKYVFIDRDSSSSYATDIRNKTKTETFEVEKFSNVSGNFIGGFQTKNSVSEFECKKAVAYYGESKSNNEGISILEAIGYAVGCFVLGLVLWFILSMKMVELTAASYIACIPYIVCFLGMLVTGQWIQALIFFLGLGALMTLLQAVLSKLDF